MNSNDFNDKDDNLLKPDAGPEAVSGMKSTDAYATEGDMVNTPTSDADEEQRDRLIDRQNTNANLSAG